MEEEEKKDEQTYAESVKEDAGEPEPEENDFDGAEETGGEDPTEEDSEESEGSADTDDAEEGGSDNGAKGDDEADKEPSKPDYKQMAIDDCKAINDTFGTNYESLAKVPNYAVFCKARQSGKTVAQAYLASQTESDKAKPTPSKGHVTSAVPQQATGNSIPMSEIRAIMKAVKCDEKRARELYRRTRPTK